MVKAGDNAGCVWKNVGTDLFWNAPTGGMSAWSGYCYVAVRACGDAACSCYTDTTTNYSACWSGMCSTVGYGPGSTYCECGSDCSTCW